MKAVVAAFNQEKALLGAFSVITNLRMELFQALVESPAAAPREPAASDVRAHAHGAEGDRGQDRGRDGRRHHPPLRQLQRDGGPGEPGLVERWEHL